MFLAEHADSIDRILDGYIEVWSGIPSFAPLAKAIKRDRDTLHTLLHRLCAGPGGSARLDLVRSHILRYAFEHVTLPIDMQHFNLFREAETVQVILEDTFGIRPGREEDEILIPHQGSALKIIVRCLLGKRRKLDENKELLDFLQILCGSPGSDRPAQDRTMRFKSMVWFVYLVIEIITVERHACLHGLEYFRSKFGRLLDCVVAGTIIDEESRKPGFESGRWEKTIFGWLQGEDRKQFVLKLRRQFNLENRLEHANRCLLSEHRRCVFEQVIELFC